MQGDGTAAALSDEPRAYTVSVHCESNFPYRKQCSDMDVGLEDDMQDDEYLRSALLIQGALTAPKSWFKPSSKQLFS